MKYTVHRDGIVEELEMSPEMEASWLEMKRVYDETDFWCKCDNQETGDIVHRGHSVDVFCKNCGGCLQVG